MSQYLTEVMERLSIGGLITLAVFLLICLIAVARNKETEPTESNQESTPCPLCGQEVK